MKNPEQELSYRKPSNVLEHHERIPYPAQWASYLHSKGFTIIAVHGIRPDGTCTCNKIQCNQPGKHPMFAGWSKGGHFKSDNEIKSFWRANPFANYGVVTNGLMVIDVDERHDGHKSFEKYLKPILGSIRTFTVKTGSGGESKQLYFMDKNNEFSNSTNLFEGIDTRANGGFVVGVGCRHKSGNSYSLIDSGTPHSNEIQIANLPNDIKALFAGNKNKQSFSKVDKFVDGNRNSSFASYAGELRRKGLKFEEIVQLLLQKNKSIDLPLEENEVLDVARSISKYPAGDELRWADPKLDFKLKDLKSHSFPNELIPNFYSTAIPRIEKSLGVPREAILVALLTIGSGLLGAAFRVRINKNSNYEETLNLWGLVVAPPSSRKSSVINLGSEPLKAIREYYSKMRQSHSKQRSEELGNLKAELNELKAKKESSAIAKRSEIQKRIEALKRHETPKWSFVTNDATPEALAELFRYNKRGVLYLSDELSGLFSKFTKKGFESFRAILCESWSGARPYQIDRMERGLVEVPSCTLAILGGIQPDVIASVFYDELLRGKSSDGLIARFQLLATYTMNDIQEPDPTISTESDLLLIKNILLGLHSISENFNLDPSATPKTLYLSEQAQELFIQFQRRITSVLRDEAIVQEAYKSHVGKLGRLALSLAAQFQVINSMINNSVENTSAVSPENMKLAIQWADYMDLQAREIYFSAGQLNSAKILIKKIRNGEITDRTTVRQIYRRGWASLQDKEAVLNAIETISESNWIQVAIEVPPGGGRPTEVVRLNPKLIEWLKSKS